MKPFMIVTANSSCARIFTADTAKSPLVEIETLVHPESRMHDRDITSDLPGKDKGGNGSGGHSYQAETEPKQYEIKVFAKHVSDYLSKAYNDGKFSDLLLISAPAFLGELRNNLSTEVSDKVAFELDKNLTQQKPEEIRKHLPKLLIQ